MRLVRRPPASPQTEEHERAISGVYKGMDAFGKHCGTAASRCRNKFQDRNQEVARDRRDDAFGRFAHLDYNCGARLQAIKSGKRCKAKIEVWGKFDGDKAAGASVDLAKGEGL